MSKWMVLFVLLGSLGFAQDVDLRLRSQVENVDFGDIGQPPGTPLSDSWVYTDSDGHNYVLAATIEGIGIFQVSESKELNLITSIPGPTSLWQDLKTYRFPDGRAYAFAISETQGTGVRVIDLSDLPNSASHVATYDGISDAHNIFIHPEARNAYAYVAVTAGSNRSGMAILDISDPMDIQEVGFWGDFSAHDIYVYHRWHDPKYDGQDMAIVWAEQSNISVVDLSDKTNPRTVSTLIYPNLSYAHSGWMDRTNRYAFCTDEGDEQVTDGNTTIRVVDYENLENPGLLSQWIGETGAIDHNVHVLGDYLYLSNYTRGFRLLDAHEPDNLVEIAAYDTHPQDDAQEFNGAWSAVPYLGHGLVSINDRFNGHFLVEVDFKASADATNRYYLPLNPAQINGETRVRVINPSDDVATFQLIAMNSEGVGTMAARRYLTGREMKIMKPADLFVGAPVTYDWIMVASSSSLAVALEGVDGDTAFATPAATSLSADLPIPHIAADTVSFFTKAGIVNAAPVVVDTNVQTSDGNQVELTVSDSETSQLVDFETLFGGSIDASQTSARVLASSDDSPVNALVGIELFGGKEVAQLAGLTLSDDAATELIYPHIANTAADWWTGLAVVNNQTSDANVTIQAMDNSGMVVADEIKTLPAGGKLIDFVSGSNRGTGLIADGIPETTSWLRITSDQPVSGYELFSDSQLRLFAGLQASTTPLTNAVLPFGGNAERYAGVAVLNPDTNAQSVTFELIDEFGQVLSQAIKMVEGRSRFVSTAFDLFRITPEIETWIRVSSADPGVYSFVLYGPNDSSWLAGLNGIGY